MSHQPITDRQVADLPLHGGRAELLEDIMRTPVETLDGHDRTNRTRPDGAPSRRRRVLASAAAAAAVVATTAGLAAWRVPPSGTTPQPGGSVGVVPSSGVSSAPSSGSSDGPKTPSASLKASHQPAPSVDDAQSSSLPADQLARSVRAAPGGAYVALDEAGWAVTSVSEGDEGIDLFYEKDGMELDLTTYPAGEHASYVADRSGELGEPQHLTLLGQSAALWSYAADEHEVIRTADGSGFLGVRGSGMSAADFRSLLADLVQTDAAGFAGSMPDGVVTPYNRDRAVAHLLRGVETPPGFSTDDVSLRGFNDGYQSAARVAGSVGCAWIDVWADGSAADRQAAVDAFEGSRSWPLLRAIADQGGYSSAFWGTADALRAGHDDKGRPLDVTSLKAGICY